MRAALRRVATILDLDVIGAAIMVAVVAIVGAGTVGLALGLAIRLFREVAGL